MASALLTLRLVAIYGLGATAVSVPLTGFDIPSESGVSLARPIAVVVAAVDGGFVLDRDGQVVRVFRDGSPPQLVASVGRRSTPFGTAVGDRVVFGGIRCEKGGCPVRVAEVIVLDRDGRVEASVVLRRASGSPTAASALDGLSLVGRDRETLWLNGGGTLFHVDVAAGAVLAEVPWPGGEPCVIDGVLYDLLASGGTVGEQGADLASTAEFRLRLRTWESGRWRRVTGGGTAMAYGQNAHCSPGGYEIRDGRRTLARWVPENGWKPVVKATEWRPRSRWLAPLSTSTGTRYAVMADGALLDITSPRLAQQGPSRRAEPVIPDLAGSHTPAAVQLDDSHGFFWCATTPRAGSGVARCGGDGWATPGEEVAADMGSNGVAEWVEPPSAARGNVGAGSPEVHHYNLCSSACGGGVRSHSRDVVAWLVDLRGPAALSLNELCYDDSVHLSGRLPAGYDSGASYIALGTATGCPGAVKQFGNQVRVLSGANGQAWWAQLPTQATMPCDHRAQECRGVACAEAGSSAGTGTSAGPGGQGQTFCTAHLETPRRDPDVPGKQAQEYMDLVTGRHDRADGPTSVLAGDFNFEPAEVDALLASEGYVQAVTGPTVNGHRPPASKQIDMIYYREPGASGPATIPAGAAAGAPAAAAAPVAPTPTAGASGATYCDIQASDHCYVMASPVSEFADAT